MSGATWRRTPVTDEYVEGGESVVFVAGRLVVLSALATSVLAHLGREPLTADRVGALLAEEFGPPPGETPTMAAATLLDRLAAEGLAEETP